MKSFLLFVAILFGLIAFALCINLEIRRAYDDGLRAGRMKTFKEYVLEK